MSEIVNFNEITSLLKNSQTIAVVGLSPKPNRPSNQVARYLIDVGYTVIPVNPGQNEILGQKCYPHLFSIGHPVDIVDIFRKSESVPSIVDEAVAIGAKVIWMQLGVIHHQAADRARKAGLTVIMDHCLKIDHNDIVR